MGKNTKIICSIIPNGRTKDLNKAPVFSLFFTPRLPDSGFLHEYYEILYWTEFKDLFHKIPLSLQVRKLEKITDASDLDGKPKSNYKISNTFQSIPHSQIKIINTCEDLAKKIPPDKFWNTLFDRNTPVHGWVLEEGEYKQKVQHLYDQKPSFKNGIHSQTDTFISQKGTGGVSDLYRQAQSDINANVLTEEEIIIHNKENQEFHKKLSILADYPHIMRLTGWIMDFTLDKDFVIEDNMDLIKVLGFDESLDLGNLDEAEKERWKSFMNELDFKCPWTHFDDKTFTYKYFKKYEDAYYKIQDGYILQKASNYSIVAEQYKRDELLQYLHGQIEAKDSKLNGNITVGNYSEMLDLTRTSTENSSNISEGIVVKIKTNEAFLRPSEFATEHQPGDLAVINDSVFVSGRDYRKLNIDDYILFGHNIDTGYVIEARPVLPNEPFRSLCRRTADYVIDRSKNIGSESFDTSASFTCEDEGWISEVANAGKSGVIYINEEICRWNNWSLICPQIGRFTEDKNSQKGKYDYNDLELINNRPPKNSLPKLRFGVSYQFRIRMVDICGNRAELDDKNTNTVESDPNVISTSPYLRLEKINPPEVFFTERALDKFNSVKPEFSGERTDVMVIRSEGGNLFADPRKQEKEAHRVISPAKINMHFLELHGNLNDCQIDNYLGDPAKRMRLYNMAIYSSEQDSPEYFTKKDKIPFLSDPVVVEYDFNFDAMDEELQNAEKGTKTIPIKNARNYLEKYFTNILLKGSASDTAEIAPDAISQEIICKLPPATFIKLVAKPKIDSKAKEDVSQIFETYSESTHAQIREISLIHAVKKPTLTKEEFKATEVLLPINPKDRDPFTDKNFGCENIEVEFSLQEYTSSGKKLHFPFSSSSEIVLRMEYDELILDATEVLGYRLEKKIVRKLFNNLKNVDQKDKKEILTALKWRNNDISTIGEFQNLKHSFGDTKYRCVDYYLEGHSRFKQFFDPEKTKEDDFIYSQQIGAKHVSNSKKLKAPVVHSIVPLFEWTNGTNWIERNSNTFRVYLEGSWYDSGLNEKLAVIFLNANPENTTYEKLQDLVSSFGKDPTTNDGPAGSLDTRNFENSLPDPINYELLQIELKKGDPITTHEGTTVKVNNVEQNILKDVRAAIFPVQFDKDKKLFFCDIRIKLHEKQLELYMPFLKLALCRYQEHSIQEAKKYDYRFSKVTMAPEVQVPPTRRIILEGNTFVIDTGKVMKKDSESKQNEFWLIKEKDNDGGFTSLSEKTGTGNTNIECLWYDRDNGKVSVAKKDLQGYAAVYIEEYEYYELDGVFKMEENPAIGYNPRNDVRKRLVFTYKLNNL